MNSKSKILPLLLFVSASSISFAQEKNFQSINNSFIAFTIKEKNLIPENLAYNPRDKSFYAGSTYQRKIVKVSSEGTTTDFIREAQDGQWMVVGIKIDTTLQQLWFCSSIGDVMKGFRDGDFGTHTGIFRYDLKTGQLIKKYLLDKPGTHFFNDLVLNKSGDVFATDMAGKAIYVIRHDKDELELFSEPPNITDPNGICISSDQKKIFIAHDEGVSSIDISSGITSLLKHASDLSCGGIDGLYFYNNSLVGIQNSMNRVIQFYLGAQLDTITNYRIIEANHPFFSMNPTTGVIIGNELYYIANSQFGSFNSHHEIFPMDKLYETVVLKATLNKQ